MYSTAFLKICKFRMFPMKYSSCTYFLWNSQSNRVVLKDNVVKLGNSVYFMIYLLCTSTWATIRAFNLLLRNNENGKDDIYDDAFEPMDESRSILIALGHLMYSSSGVPLMVCALTRLMQKRKEFVLLANLTFDHLERYQGKSQQTILYSF